ncbi:MAG: hypothetical protein ACOX4D_00885 [Bacteroidales bacterium]|jgi:hypothetical protein
MFVNVAYLVLLLIPLVMGLIFGMQRSIPFGKSLGFAVISGITLLLCGMLGLLIVNLLYKLNDISYLAGVMLLLSSVVIFLKGKKSNTFIMSADSSTALNCFLANLGVGMNVLISVIGISLYAIGKNQSFKLHIYYLLLYGLFSIIFYLMGSILGKTLKSIKPIKIILKTCGILLFLLGIIVIFVIK